MGLAAFFSVLLKYHREIFQFIKVAQLKLKAGIDEQEVRDQMKRITSAFENPDKEKASIEINKIWKQ